MMGRQDGLATSRRAGVAARAALALAWLALAAVTALAQTTPGETDLERRVKAAFLYQFIPYVNWPEKAQAAPDAPIVIAVVGSEAAVVELNEVIGPRSIGPRPVVVRRWRDSDAQGGPHVVFVTRALADRTAAVARAAQAHGMLVVAEHENALEQGAMIGFRLVEGRVRFDVALGAVERAGLRISARLLTVAQSVRAS
jgi:hypothetical protein